MGRLPIALNDAGRAQCHAVAPLVRDLGPARIVTSPLARARETAAIVAASLQCPLAVDDDLVEFDFGTWEGRSYDSLLADPTYLAFSSRPLEARPPGRESLAAAQARALAGVGRALGADPDGSVCVVTHGDLIRLLLATFLALDLGEFRRLRVDTCGLAGVELTGDWAEVKFMNLVADPRRVWERLHWGR